MKYLSLITVVTDMESFTTNIILSKVKGGRKIIKFKNNPTIEELKNYLNGTGIEVDTPFFQDWRGIPMVCKVKDKARLELEKYIKGI